MSKNLFHRVLLIIAALVPCLTTHHVVLADDPTYSIYVTDYSDVYVDPGANGTYLYVNLMAEFWTDDPIAPADPDVLWWATVTLDGNYLCGALNMESDYDPVWNPDVAMSRDENSPSIIAGSVVMLLPSGHHVVHVDIHGQGVPAEAFDGVGTSYDLEFDVP